MAPKRSRSEVMASKQTMGCSSKRPSVAEDRLSSLPDHLLHNIMSFLTVRQAVHTCVLSRRWSRLWCSMPCLDIDQREFGGAMVDRTAWESERARFEEFVDNLLMFHNASALDRFRCHVTRCSFEAFERWVCHGIKFSPAVLEILFPRSYDMFSLLPSGFTSCRLKRLHVSGIILGRSCTQQLHSGFPVLEDLQLDRCHLDSSEITSHTLKNLIVTGCTSYFDTVLTITAPALATFHLAYTNRFNCWRGIMVNETPSLVKASVGLPSLVKASVCSESLVASCNLLCSLVNVQILELSGSETLSLLHMGSDAFPTFRKLRTLLFDGCKLSHDFKILGCFLNNAPSLEKLTLHCCMFPGRHPVQISSQQCLDKITLQCANLKWTEIRKKLSGKWSNLRNSSITVTKA